MEKLSLATHTLFADLQQKCDDATFLEQYPESGSFTTQTHKDRKYYYYNGYRSGGGDGAGKRKYSKYVGPADDPEIAKRVMDFHHIKASYRERRRLVSALVSMGMNRADSFSGDLVEMLWKAGAFRLRAVLVGTTAFRTYSGLLGVKLKDAHVSTEDVDIAQFHSISMAVKDSIPTILEVLKEIDPTFGEVPHRSDGRATCTFVNDRGFKLEFLTPNSSKAEYGDKPARMPALGGASAQPLRFMDFLIHQPVSSVLLHKAGIPVRVPAPERYAVHKLIVAADRRKTGTSLAKSRKDVAQAGFIIEAFREISRLEDIGYAWMEAWERGHGWQSRLKEGASRLESIPSELLKNAILKACREDGCDPALFGATGVGPKP